MKRREFLYVAGISAVRPSAARSLQAGDPLEELSGLVKSKMAEHHVPGVAFGILRNGDASVRTFGVTSIEDPQPVTPETIFPIASISKTFAATTIMRLTDQGKIELKTPIRKYISDFKVQDDDATRDVTVLNLLTHTPGWEGQLDTEDRGLDTLNFFTAGLHDMAQISAPGTVWSYNNAGFGVAGRLIEVVTGKHIHDALKEFVYTPLALQRAFSRSGEAMTYRFAMPHRQKPQSGPTEVIHDFELPANTTAGGIATTVSDLLSYARFHLGDGTAGGQQVLSRAALDLMKTPQLKKNSTDDEMGIGWHLRHLNGVITAAHGGTLAGHCLHIQLVPSRNLAFLILTNHTDGWRLIQDVERATLKAYAGLTLTPNQAIGHRGVAESMTAHARPLEKQPALDQYVGSYQRPPLGKYEVKVDNGHLSVTFRNPSNTNALLFYGPDIAYVSAGPAYTGTPYEFIRNAEGKVGWMRIQGRIAKKEI